MGLYIKTQDGYEIEQRTAYSKIKYKDNKKEIDEVDFYFKTDISTVELIDLSTNTTINKELIEKLKKLLIEEIILPENIEIIGDEAFEVCESLQEIKLPKELKTIGYYAFANCKRLKEINLPNGLKEIGFCAFYNCILLEKIEIPSTIEYISPTTFKKCNNLKEIIFEDESYKEKKGLKNFIKEYKDIIKIKSLDEIIKTNIKNEKQELSKLNELEI